MKRKVLGLALTAMMALGAVSAFASSNTATQTGAGTGNGTQNKSCVALCTTDASDKIASVVAALKEAGNTELAAKIENGNFENLRAAKASLSEAERVEVTNTMSSLGIRGNGNFGCAGTGLGNGNRTGGCCK